MFQKYTLRPYQQQAVDTAVRFFRSEASDFNALEVLPTGSGKSLIIANIALQLGEPVLIFQPSKEILEQNYKKVCSYGFIQCGIYSASFNSRNISKITFCTIGSVIHHLNALKGIKYCIIDECHGVNANGGMYETMISTLGVKVLGLTATPYRLYSYSDGAILKFLTRTRPCIFTRVIHVTQVREILNAGFLARLNYYEVKCAFDLSKVKLNSTGCDFDEKSLIAEYKRSNFASSIEDVVKRLMYNGHRTHILVFTKFVNEAAALAAHIPNTAYVSGETPKDERDRILKNFKSGKIHCLANVGVLSCGFDMPELDTILLARPTRSLALYYQMVGRAIRPYPNKIGWIVDLCGTYKRFGKVENLELRCEGRYKWAVWNAETNRQLTNVLL
jgi:DNA repair protein RadD